MKVFKSIMLYLLLLIGVALAAVLICCVIMICSPRTVVFGYKYVSFKEKITENPIELGAVSAVSVTSNRMDIIIVPNTESNEVLISYSQGMSGFVKADAPDLKVEITASKAMEFDSGDTSYGSGTTYNTFCVNVKEPDGWMFLGDCHIKVALKTNKTFTVINASSNKGIVAYLSTAENEYGTKKTIGCTNLYLTSKSKDTSEDAITIKYPNASRYYVKTSVGDCYFINDDAAINGDIIFESTGGELVAKSGALRGDLTVRSSADVNGASLDITTLNGNLTYHARSGNIDIGTIDRGSNAAYPMVDIQSEYCSINVTTLIGTITTQGYEGGDIDNIDVNIKNLTYAAALARNIDINSGAGNIYITNLNGVANLVSSTGNITVKNATSNINLETYNGRIKLDFSDGSNNQTRLNINVLYRSNITVHDVKGNVNINVGKSAGRDIVLSLHDSTLPTGSSSAEIHIYSDNDNVQIKTKESALAVYTDGKISREDVAQTTKIISSHFDYDSTYTMDVQKRYNYASTDRAIRYSKLYIHGEGKTQVFGRSV